MNPLAPSVTVMSTSQTEETFALLLTNAASTREDNERLDDNGAADDAPA